MVSMIHGFRVHQNHNRPTSKADERTVNQQKTPILSTEAALHIIAKQFNIGTFLACMCLRPQKHKRTHEFTGLQNNRESPNIFFYGSRDRYWYSTTPRSFLQ